MIFGKDNLGVKRDLTIEGKTYKYFSLNEASKKLAVDISRMPVSLKIILENSQKKPEIKYNSTSVTKENELKPLLKTLIDMQFYTLEKLKKIELYLVFG